MGIYKRIGAVLAVIVLSGCAVQNFNSYVSPNRPQIEKLLVVSLTSSYHDANLQEQEFCDTLDSQKITCLTTEGYRKPGFNFSPDNALKLSEREKVDHVLLVGLISSDSINESMLIQSGSQTQIINGISEQKLFQIQLTSMLSGEVVYSAEVETEYGKVTADFQKRTFYGQIFEEVVTDWKQKGIH
ncbi:hypothetical protein [Idiomarina zobellii]|uniref:Uncharacterized protein n=1 Tax=Idiomarina zobellii TaxID=86103 RepID=A0A837NGX3_9GAMM|nr:hypothetical protein [Idiomarina zobellii]KPD23947.1 hypothetical protein AFK76_05280 [Idiomarina zobellii]SDF85649.1 hypothetical protein SAMN04515658_105175 [Idiomarina zobellii]